MNWNIKLFAFITSIVIKDMIGVIQTVIFLDLLYQNTFIHFVGVSLYALSANSILFRKTILFSWYLDAEISF